MPVSWRNESLLLLKQFLLLCILASELSNPFKLPRARFGADDSNPTVKQSSKEPPSALVPVNEFAELLWINAIGIDAIILRF
mmetsp:Transcript_8348/g.17875  ORF Transcript_8348/g.17875 Transcript_8348/m.17875 type:complete len:82 (+) Transcript_8348:408-653(+)